MRADIPAVADLYCEVFLKQAAPYPSADRVRRTFEDVFFDSPFYDEDIASLVSVTANDDVSGFLGVTARPFQFMNRPVRGAVSVHFMTSPRSANKLTGLQLLRTFFGGPQDFSVTDGANQFGRAVWEGLGGLTPPGYSFHWTKVFRPGALALSRASAKLPLGLGLRAVGRPFVALGDRWATQSMPHRFAVPASSLPAVNLTPELLQESITQQSAVTTLRPDYSGAALAWLLQRAAAFLEIGSLQQVAVRDDRGATLGWYLYYLNVQGTSHLLQIGARRQGFSAVFDDLCRHASDRGALALSGHLEPRQLPVLADRYCTFSGGTPWFQIHSRHADIVNAFLHGDAWFGDLDGEWCTSFRGS